MSRLLIVDDEPMVLDVLRRLLEEPGRDVATATGPDQALEVVRCTEIDVALVDKNLEGASGLVLARQLKAIQPEAEIILITGYASLETAVEAVQIGAFDYLTKPIDDYAALSLKVQSAVEKCKLRRGQQALLERLMEAEERYRRLVEAAPDAVIAHDEQGHVRDANAAAVRLYHYSAEEFRKQRVGQLGPCEPGRQVHRRNGGEEFFAEVSCTEVTVEGEKLRVVSVRDVTDAVRAEKERLGLEERLRLAQKMEAVGRLAGGVAHDFNNLLAVISAHAEFLSGQLGRTHASYPEVDGIMRAAQRGAALTRQLLLFSRRKPLAQELVDLNQAASEVHKLLARVLGETVQLTMVPEPQLALVRADPDQIGQVIINLAVNARDAMPRGGRIVVRTDNVQVPAPRAMRGGEIPAGSYVSLSVEDTGTGMTDEVLSRLFEPFFTTKEFGKGTGLGLATVYGIVRGCGGGIDVESRPGKGTTFLVYLPAAVDAERDARRVVDAPQRGRGETILVVEDEAPLRALVRRILVNHGYSVLEANDGEDGLRRSAQHDGTIHLLLTDIVMPQMGGRELADRLSRERPKLRVLFMTGYSDQASPEPALAAPLILKPFTTLALLGEVRRTLDRRLKT
jgi:two-component system, cell cycle sensor histidine kinase and response regulator CckA